MLSTDFKPINGLIVPKFFQIQPSFSPDLQKYDEMEVWLKVCLHHPLCSSSMSTPPRSLPLCFAPENEIKWNSTATGWSSTRCAWTIKRVIVIKSRLLETRLNQTEEWVFCETEEQLIFSYDFYWADFTLILSLLLQITNV